jgi:hypothetical protein
MLKVYFKCIKPLEIVYESISKKELNKQNIAISKIADDLSFIEISGEKDIETIKDIFDMRGMMRIDSSTINEKVIYFDETAKFIMANLLFSNVKFEISNYL